MTWRTIIRVLTAVTGLVLLLAGVAGCNLVRTPSRAGQVLTGPEQPASLLVLILGSRSASARAALSRAVVTTARTGEQILVLSASGRTLGAFRAPSPPELTGPPAIARPGGDATTFQRARYNKIEARAQAAMAGDLRLLTRRERHSIEAWADRVVAQAWSAAEQPSAAAPSVTRALSAATADVTALNQAGSDFGPRLVLDIIDVQEPDGPPMHLDASLAGMTVVLTGIPDSLADASWQADLLQAGAVRAYVLPSAADSVMPGLISSGLAGQAGFPFTIAGLDYAPGRYAVPRSAAPSLRKLLRLLTSTYPTATATINAYTDSVPVPGGNVLLAWRRARGLLAWLVDRGVAAYRLAAIGHGSADPVAPNKPGGQPLNRRVVVIVSPVG